MTAPARRRRAAPRPSTPWLCGLARLFNRVFASRLAKVATSAVVLIAAVRLVRRQLREVKLGAVASALRATSVWAVVQAIGSTAASQVCLAAVEWRIPKFVGRP